MATTSVNGDMENVVKADVLNSMVLLAR